jgi:hypothetical protein
MENGRRKIPSLFAFYFSEEILYLLKIFLL